MNPSHRNPGSRFTNSRFRIRASSVLAWAGVLGLMASQAISPVILPASAQASNCDCSCESYGELKRIMESLEAQQNSDQPKSIPPEMMKMSMCAGQCAMAWAQCENPDMDLSGMREAQRRALERQQQGQNSYSGESAIARERAINERSIGETEKNLTRAPDTISKDKLAADYLEGTWCSVYGGQEKAQWRFDGSGSHEVGLPAGNGWAMQRSGDSIGDFHQRFETLIEMQPDTFTTVHQHGRKNVFTRGPCD